jgi:hypothetical protein
MKTYFTIEELCNTDTGFANVPNAEQLKNLQYLIDTLLNPVSVQLGMAICVNSGFRSQQVNVAVKGQPNSQHLKGEAADITCADNAQLYRLIKEHLLFDQLIWEKGNDTAPLWIHVSIKRNGQNRKQTLRIR